jgi:hypothetical protein
MVRAKEGRMKRLLPSPTYANVVSTLCLFILLGGASYAAVKLPKNSVGSKQLKKNAVTAAKIKKEAVTAAKVKKGTITGAQINASTVGTVPLATNAAKAGHAETASTAAKAGLAETASALSPPEPVRFVGDPGEPQFENSYETFPEESPAGFWKDHGCMVHLTGVVAGPSESGAFSLPAAYWPLQESSFAVIRPSTAVQLAWAVIEENGQVRLYFGPGAESSVSLDGISFRAAGC